MDKSQIEKAIANAIKSGNWMIRKENDDGVSPSKDANGFKWKPVGQWTIAPDWNSQPVCGGGLHGQASEAGGQQFPGKHIAFCETRGERIIITGDKIKVKAARRLMVGQLPPGLIFKSSLDLSGCDLKGSTLPGVWRGHPSLSCVLRPKNKTGWKHPNPLGKPGIHELT